ncbi:MULTISPECIES: hypothetical protein [Streptomyces]|uniref:hypothetical protein n=1 Tax=Streptomyces TaxID=1883 RepID=UPI002930D7D5|nr:hypothetical protein [Streptomyces sp. NEAU-HV9]
MTTDAWQQVRAALVSWWRRMRPNQADRVDAALVDSRSRVLTARRAHDEDAEAELVAAWEVRLTALLSEDSALTGELRRLIEEEIAPLLRRGDGAQAAPQEFRAEASGHGRVYQAGHDQNIYEP